MIRRFSAVLFAVVLAVVFSTVTRAQDSTKAEPMKEGKPGMMKMEKDMGKGDMGKAAGMKEMAMGPLKSVTCDPACGFMARSHDEKELTDIIIKHAKKYHNKTVTAKEVKGMMKTEEEAPAKQ